MWVNSLIEGAGVRDFLFQGALIGYGHGSAQRKTCSDSNPSQLAVEPVSVSGANTCRERVSQRQRPGGDFRATAAYSGRQRLGSFGTPAPKPRKIRDNFTGGRKPSLRRTAWWRTHSTATGLHPEFPDNREINREFFDFGPFSAILIPNRQVNSGGYNKIPYATEQGIFSAEQGIFLREQGISAGQQGSGIGEPISSGRKHPGTGMRRQVSAWFSTKALPGMARPIAA